MDGFTPALLGDRKTKDAGFVNFNAHKYGESSYLLTMPSLEMEPGEYGIVYVSLAMATEVPVGTFSIQE